jgi:hypothetical protein
LRAGIGRVGDFFLRAGIGRVGVFSLRAGIERVRQELRVMSINALISM